MNLLEKLRGTIAQTLELAPDAITETSSSDNVAGWDSVGHVNLMVALEQTFDVRLEIEDFPRLTSVPAILNYLRANGLK